MDKSRRIKDLLYEQVARIGKASSSPKRLELIELLCQGEKTVEGLAHDASISMKLASAHLRVLRSANLVESDKQGKNVIYRIANRAVVEFWISIRSLAEDRLVELKMALTQLTSHPKELSPQDRESLVKLAKKGDVVVLDVRPTSEYEAAHLPYAQSMPIEELKSRLAELPHGKTIVAYCRGPYCLMAVDAVQLLKQQGFDAIHLPEGVAEWGMAPVRTIIGITS
ncbi:MAG: metalloregulator ArsR/SmtB family transcription factor [Gammaproteobacteria bacterium]|nr:metalloregulator ArsR/SmtB family transcription factor [Rhodocyclaceae bacterium]MBU3908668.1 metalloregulator ArsR/SmtB family transcription factor [Gammaproteobacteria bacterium]MBU3988967.1 metalloregulator ArsR/SmtB family transcription factor [Gammaproteobacteria bacterium]MBU4004696.1 metalloregulator ArsR/SmtB family transcription factor [Gammaproteobacteria bacterium]MBU4021299.1 metalloregulator ArsR/SmtB family transcription factor [Gammaproteobacteria bacterium]